MDNILNITSTDQRFVIKRSGDKVLFEPEKIKNAVLKAMDSVGKVDTEIAEKIARLVKKGIFRNDKTHIPHVDEIHDMVENKLMDNGLNDVAKEYIIYRSKHQPNIFSKRVNLKPYEYPELVEYIDAIRHSYWVHTEFNFTSDIQDFKVHLSEKEKLRFKERCWRFLKLKLLSKHFGGTFTKECLNPKSEMLVQHLQSLKFVTQMRIQT